MKLSLDKKLGWIQVKGQRLVEVTHEHQVPTRTENVLDPHEPKRDAKWVTAKLGDYAVEMVAVKTGNVVGYSYLSGDAIRLNLYRDKAPDHWFKDAVMKRLELECDAFIEHVLRKQDGARLLAGLLRAKYFAGASLITFRTYGANKAAADDAWRAIGESLMYVPADDETNDPAHFVGVIEYPPRGQLCCHSQPPRHAGKHPCSGFQIEMLVRMDAPVFDPWPEVVAERAEFVP